MDLAVKDIVSNPSKGEMKKGDLAGVQVYKFRHLKEQMLLAKIATYFPIDEEFSLDYCTSFKKIISECIENKEDFYNINILDYFLFLLKY